MKTKKNIINELISNSRKENEKHSNNIDKNIDSILNNNISDKDYDKLQNVLNNTNYKILNENWDKNIIIRNYGKILLNE